MSLLAHEWLAFCRRATGAARDAVRAFPTTAERSHVTGRGAGGDRTLAIDRAAEEAVLEELEALGVPLTVVTEERGELDLEGGGPTRVLIDPVDGSLNARRGLPFASVSIAIAAGTQMTDVNVGFVAELGTDRDWWALRGEGAFCDGVRLASLEPGPLEILGVEGTHPRELERVAPKLTLTGAARVRSFGSVALMLCLVASGGLDAMLDLSPIRSIDVAAAQLIVREAGGAVSVPAGGSLDLLMRSPVFAARDRASLVRLMDIVGSG